MGYHHTKTKGDIGLTKVIADLTEKGYPVSIPISEHLQYDLIVEDENGNLKKIQVKYRSNGIATCSTVHVGSDGSNVKRKYKVSEIDFYAVYLPDIKECVYIPFTTSDVKVRTTIPNSYTHYHWWEDYRFPNRTEIAPMRSINDISGFKPVIARNSVGTRKVLNRPSKEELQALVDNNSLLAIGKMYGVSDNAIRKWGKACGVITRKRKPKLSQPETVINN